MFTLKSLLLVYLAVASWNSLNNNVTLKETSPKYCLVRQNTLSNLISCLDAFTVSRNFYDASSYAAAQPTNGEISAWKTIIRSMLDTNSCDCSDIRVPLVLAHLYAVTMFLDTDTSRKFCVLSEITTSVHRNYTKGWGLMIVPASAKHISRPLHISAPHPQADINTPQQAGAIFSLVGAHSLLISGRFRSAYAVGTDCVLPGRSQKRYFKTDPTHDIDEPFSVANQVIRNWQNANGGCPSQSCAYVQLHGKGASSCAADTIFISSGLGTSPSSLSWYQNTTLDIPARRLRDEARSVFPSWTSSLPSDNPKCSLTATGNVFGRLVNGVPETDVCVSEASALTATAEFIHIEQAIVARQSNVYEKWGEVFRRVFRTSCTGRTVEDSKTGLCV
ncbi:hypothetical protein C8R42DRAFT_5045 [Lentinula raphanica]|nr:hypothetical protein C8R42DRAFT_5045 [Lentinula raphanica]